ncbi:MAG TPA: thiamine pyrophosphate-dependent enzyme [Mycobacterium sp.]|nr:thiamine pyrophosphate-dependent enzyme [Mycobacterium sp.]HTX95043.1 thiamine pyrophosphate-dependent enzyme [Mycobacterium sp.]
MAAQIAVSWRLPVVFIVEKVRDMTAAGPRSYVADCHGMPVLSANGKDVGAVRDSVAEAVRRASSGAGPDLVNAVTYRTNHPSGVDPLVFERR